jgi:manganese/iron transport system substrate-binding protein
MTRRLFSIPLLLVILMTTLLSGCGAPAGVPSTGAASNGKLRVIATTTIVGDVVKQVAGDAIQVDVLIPPDVDEHSYEPSAQDVVKVSEADLVFLNGAGLEQFLQRLVDNAGKNVHTVSVSDGIPLLQGPEAGENTGGDPHVWMDPNNVLVWVDNIEKALASADPQNAAAYQSNAAAYRQQLKDLDAWITTQVAQIPADRRKLVTDHTVFTYFAARYGFTQVGAIVPNYSSAAASSAQEMAALETGIQQQGVPAIFVGNTVNPAMAERVAQDTGTRLVHILTGSLTDKNGKGPTYIDYMKYNVSQIVDGLK